MTVARFVATRAADWNDLDRLASIKKLPVAERRRLPALYRVALVDLGQLRTYLAREVADAGGAASAASAGQGADTLNLLNAIVARAHARIALHRKAIGIDARHFFGERLPLTIRQAVPRMAVAAAVVAVSMLVAFCLCRDNVALAQSLAGPNMGRNARGFAEMGQGRAESADAVMAAFYVTNNVRVAFLAFALGVTFGIGTLIILVQNGVIVGVTLALVRHHGALENFLAFIASHVFVELFAILLAAAAGLALAHALVAPAPYTRVVALRRVAGDVATLVMGAACLLVVAAGFEAFVSPSAWTINTKLAIGGLNAVWLVAYVAFVGRRRRPVSSLSTATIMVR